jgi:RNase H-like domain found in reverse transcriptase
MWTATHQKCFDDMQKQLENLTTMAHPDPKKVMCVLTDDSDKHYGGMVTQIPTADLELPFDKQRHQPLAFSSGTFKGAELRWGTPENEVYALVHLITTFDYLLLRNASVRIMTDPRNIVYIYNPLSVDQSLARHTVHKLQRWALKRSVFNYIIEHINGTANVWADIVSRWGAGYQRDQVAAPHLLGALFQAPYQLAESERTLPNLQDILQAQKTALKKKSNSNAPCAQGQQEVRFYDDGAIWIPDAALDVQLRNCVVAHCGCAGHRDTQATRAIIESKVRWSTLKADVDKFMASCLLWKLSQGGEAVPVPHAETIHTDEPSRILHFDYLYLGPSRSVERYCLIFKDDATAYVWLFACKKADAATTVQALM